MWNLLRVGFKRSKKPSCNGQTKRIPLYWANKPGEPSRCLNPRWSQSHSSDNIRAQDCGLRFAQETPSSEIIFTFLNCRDADIDFKLPANSLCYPTKGLQAFSRRRCDTRNFVGTVAYNNKFWMAFVEKLGSNVVHFKHIKINCGRRCCCKHMLLNEHRTIFGPIWRKRTEVSWVRGNASHFSKGFSFSLGSTTKKCFLPFAKMWITDVPVKSWSQLICAPTAISSFFTTATSWRTTASVVPVSVSSGSLLLSPREASVSNLNWSDSSLEKRRILSAGDPTCRVSGTEVSKIALWSARVAFSSPAPEDVVGFGSKNVKVVTVWEVVVMAGASLHLGFCRVRSKVRATVVPQNSHSKILFWRSETKDSLFKGIKLKS